MNDSMHRDHDTDLVSALAEGRLSDPEAARLLVDSCPECAELYAAHLTVLAAVREEPAPHLEELERAGLHRAVWRELEAARRPSASPTPWWYRLVPAAAALVLLVGVGAIINSGLLGSGDQAASEAALQTTSADAGAEGADDSPTELAPLSDRASEETEAENFAEPEATALAEADEAVETDYTGHELEDALAEFRQRAADRDTTASDQAFECDPPPDSGRLLAVESATVDGDPVWFVAYGEPDQVGHVVAFRQADCDVLLVDE